VYSAVQATVVDSDANGGGMTTHIAWNNVSADGYTVWDTTEGKYRVYAGTIYTTEELDGAYAGWTTGTPTQTPVPSVVADPLARFYNDTYDFNIDGYGNMVTDGGATLGGTLSVTGATNLSTLTATGRSTLSGGITGALDFDGGDQTYLSNNSVSILSRVGADLRHGVNSFWTTQGFYTGGNRILALGAGNVTIDHGAGSAEALTVKGSNFTRFSVDNTGTGTGNSLTSFAVLNETGKRYFQAAAYASSGFGSRYGLSLNGMVEFIAVENTPGGLSAMSFGQYNSTTAPVVFVTNAVERFRMGALGGITFSTSVSKPYVAKTGNYTLTINDRTVECTTNASTQTLPTAVGCNGREYRIINATGTNVTVATTSSQTIGNAITGNPTSVILGPEEWLDVISNNANWRII
jgi:hypothetical protein